MIKPATIHSALILFDIFAYDCVVDADNGVVKVYMGDTLLYDMPMDAA